MGFAIGGTGGLSLIETSSEADRPYDPVIGAYREQDASLLYRSTADVYHLLSDRDLLPQIWRGFLQIAADLYLTLLCSDSSQSLGEVPLDYQRKYDHLQLDHTLDLTAPASALTAPTLGEVPMSFSPQDEAFSLSSSCRRGFDASFVPLNSGADQRAWLSWSVTLTFSLREEGSYVFFGYFEADSMEDSLLVGVRYDGAVVLANFSSGDLNHRVSASGIVPVGSPVTLSCIYDGGTLYVTVTDAQGSSLGSIDFLLEDGLFPGQFVAKVFGVCTLDLRTAGASELSATPARKVEALITGMTYMDPTLGSTYQAIPFLQDEWDTPTFLWTEGDEFNLLETSEGDHFLSFQQSPPAFVLAEYVSHDLGLVEEHYGKDVNLSGPNTELYREQVRALHYAFWKGPTIANVRLGVQVLLGLPFTAEAGVVASINPSYSGLMGEILIRGETGLRSYLYPLSVTPSVSAEEEVEAFVPLTDGVLVLDWRNSPDWFVPLLGSSSSPPTSSVFLEATGLKSSDPLPNNEVKKFHTFAVEILAEVVPEEGFVSVQSFISTIKQTWKSFIISIRQDLEDDVDIDDPLDLDTIVGLFDRAGGGLELVAPYYGAPGEPPYDYQYGQESPAITYGMFEEQFPDDPIDLSLTNTGVSTVTILVNGSPVDVDPLEEIQEQIP